MPKAITILPASGLLACFCSEKAKDPVEVLPVVCLVLIFYGSQEPRPLHPGEDFAVVGYVPGETLQPAEELMNFLGYLGADESKVIYAEAAKQMMAERAAQAKDNAGPAAASKPKATARAIAEPIPAAPERAADPAPATPPEAAADSPIANRSLT